MPTSTANIGTRRSERERIDIVRASEAREYDLGGTTQCKVLSDGNVINVEGA